MSERNSASGVNRRSVIKSTGVAGLIGLAGCVGGGDDDGAAGGTDTPMDENGDDGDTATPTKATTTPTEPVDVTVAIPPTGWWAVLATLAQDEGYLEDASAEVGANADFTFAFTWGDVPAWVSGNADIAQFGALEASRIGPREDQEITVFGKNTPLNFGPMIRIGGDLDPTNTGSVEASVDKIVNDEAKFAIGAWGGADATSYDVAFGSIFDHRFKEQGGDFNVVTAGYFSIGKLVADGQIDVGSSGEGMGAAPQMMNGSVKPLFWLKDIIPRELIGKETKWGFPTMQNIVARTNWFDENTRAAEAYFESQKRALAKLHEDPVQVITRSDEYIETMGAGSQREAEFIVNYGIERNSPLGVPSPEHASVYDTAGMSDEYVQTQRDFLDTVAEVGLTESNWKDFVTHHQF